MKSAKPKLTAKQYLEADRGAGRLSEYSNGELYELPPATVTHSQILINTVLALKPQIAAIPATIVASSVRVCVQGSAIYTYPDIAVTVGKMQFEDQENDSLLNPTVLVEIYSRWTANRDLGRKFEWYRDIPSVQNYVAIAEDHLCVTCYTRLPEKKWMLRDFRKAGGVLEIEAIGSNVPLSEIYRDIELHPEEE